LFKTDQISHHKIVFQRNSGLSSYRTKWRATTLSLIGSNESRQKTVHFCHLVNIAEWNQQAKNLQMFVVMKIIVET